MTTQYQLPTTALHELVEVDLGKGVFNMSDLWRNVCALQEAIRFYASKPLDEDEKERILICIRALQATTSFAIRKETEEKRYEVLTNEMYLLIDILREYHVDFLGENDDVEEQLEVVEELMKKKY